MRFGIQAWNPEKWRFGRELSSLQKEMDRLLEEFSSDFPRLTGRRDIDFVPPCDIEETDDQYLVNVDLPGMKKEDLKVELAEDTLVISGSHQQAREEQTKTRKMSERFQGRFQRAFLLPNAGAPSKVEATYTEGVLRIKIPKEAAAKTTSIPIGEAKAVAGEKASKTPSESGRTAAA